MCFQVDDIPPEQHALVPSFMGGGGKRIHPLPYADPNLPVQPRSMDPSKDLAAYGYGSVAWKERMESWKQKQERLHQMRNDGGGKDWDGDGDDGDLPLYDFGNFFGFSLIFYFIPYVKSNSSAPF
jgi:cellulose synthase A